MKLMSKYFEPFNPQSLQKIFQKFDQSESEAAAIHDINNTSEGLCNYISASNIKNKVRSLSNLHNVC